MMAKKNNSKKNSKLKKQESEKPSFFPEFGKNYVFGLMFFLLAIVVLLSFVGQAGGGGKIISKAIIFIFGKKTAYLTPLFLLLLGAIFFVGGKQSLRTFRISGLALLSCLTGIATVLNSFENFKTLSLTSLKQESLGGAVGQIFGFPMMKFFGFWVNLAVFGGLIVFGFVIFWQISLRIKPKAAEDLAERPEVLKRIFEPKVKIKQVSGQPNFQFAKESEKKSSLPLLKTKPVPQSLKTSAYKKPGFDLLEPDRGEPTTGDIRNNMAIIKKTLENFGIPVEMSEVNIGPTVTQYTLKPAEGIKLSKITALNSDLSLALATHPIRIEAPIPGKSLVGIEIPNKTRIPVRLKTLFEEPGFVNSPFALNLALGRDVAGNPCFTDLGRMPHLLVAGSTGTGKTICLNSIILSLIYRNSPEVLRMILVDPKRVEFPVYQDLPHLLAPVIFDSQKTVNAFKWLVKEMERRFEVLAAAKARDINSYNRDMTLKMQVDKQSEEELELMPYIVVIVDELADLMAARGKEVEAGIVRLAQMARAVGIHLVVATQRPSVEVITGLIKANITSRITFQVASQVDSRTVIDMSGAEKLLGAGDMLFISSETAKPRRIQGAYVTDKEVKRVIDFLKGQKQDSELLKENFLAEELERELETVSPEGEEFFGGGVEDPLYLPAKQLVIESKKASASLLQRRLRVGYARAARLLDILEQRGVVGPADGAKPRQVYLTGKPEMEAENEDTGTPIQIKHGSGEEKDDEWEKV